MTVIIRKVITTFSLLAVLGGVVACLPQKEGVVVTNASMVETPKTFPAAAIFMTIENHTDTDIAMIGFATKWAGRTELHTMALENDIMRMRKVENFPIPAGGVRELKHMGDHVMLFDLPLDFNAGERFSGTAHFDNGDALDVTVHIKSRDDAHTHVH